MKDLIHLQHANANQLTNEGVKSKWEIRANGTDGENLYSLDPFYSEEQVFEILAFGRHFEMVAFRAGIEHQKKYSKAMYEGQMLQQADLIQNLKDHNEMLANKLESLIGEEK